MPKNPSNKSGDKLHWCGHRVSEHTGPGGACKYNTEESDVCDCDGLDE